MLCLITGKGWTRDKQEVFMSIENAGTTEIDADKVVARLERIPFSRLHLRSAAILGGGTFFDAYDAVAIGTALTVVFTALHIGFANAGFLIGAAYVGQFVGAVVAGALAEIYGRKSIFALSLIVFGFFSLGIAISWNFQSLLIFRVLQGLGLGAEIPVAGALLNEFIPGKKRGVISISYQNMFGWGNFLTPLIGAAVFVLIGPQLGWRIIFLIGAFPLVLGVLSFVFLQESPRWLIEHGKVTNADHVVAQFEKSFADRGMTLPIPEPLPAKVHAEVRSTNFAELFSPAYRSRTLLIWIMFATTYFVTYGYSGWLPILYVQIGGLPITQSLLLTALLGACLVVNGYVFANLVDKVGRRRYFICSFVLIAVGATFGVIGSLLIGPGWPILFATTLILGIGTYPINIGLYLYSSELFPTRIRSWATGTGSSLQRLASAISPSIVGLLVAHNIHTGIGKVFGIFVVIAIIGLLSVIFLGRETQARVLEELAA
jgi:MFS transporter, putative metabolite:H+ symporter